MGPFEIAAGTQWDDGRTWNHEMFPEKEQWPHFAEQGVRKFPKRGDISCRSALTIHRGTAHASPIARPVLVLGCRCARCGARRAARHDGHAGLLRRAAARSCGSIWFAASSRRSFPISQKHDIEGLVMGVEIVTPPPDNSVRPRALLCLPVTEQLTFAAVESAMGH